MEKPLPLLPVAPSYLNWNGHQLALYRSGAGRPVLLIHSINAAASAFEMRGPFIGLGADFAIHALDFLGYGNSDRPERRYRPEDYIAQIGAVLEHIGEPTDVIASSLGAAYAVEATARWPARVNKLTLVCPTGMGLLTQSTGLVGWAIYRMLRGPVGRAIFHLLTTPRSIRLFLGRQAYHAPQAMDAATVASFHMTSRQPGAFYAPICFLTGLLNCDIRASFPTLRQPVLLVWGQQATTTPVRSADAFLAANPMARLQVIDRASMLVQDEHPAAFNRLVREFLLAP